MQDLERTFVHYRNPAPPGNSGIIIREGRLPVLFSAPHSARHKRNNFWKKEDEYTGALAEHLHRTTDAHAIYLSHQIDPDPHDDDANNPYKQALAHFIATHPIALVIDLHGLSAKRPFGIALGTMDGISCPEYEALIVQAFCEAGFVTHKQAHLLDQLVINHPRYTGGLARPTITRFVSQRLGIAAMQVEINAWLRIEERLPSSTNALQKISPHFRGDAERMQRTLAVLQSVVALIQKSVASRNPAAKPRAS